VRIRFDAETAQIPKFPEFAVLGRSVRVTQDGAESFLAKDSFIFVTSKHS